MKLKSVKEIKNLRGKRVLLRADLNVPLKKLEVRSRKSEIKVADDFKIRRALPTIEYLIKNEAKVILISHLGQPKGKVVEELRMKPIEKFLISNFQFPITYCQETIDLKVKKEMEKMREGEVILLENLRFHPEEEENDPKFAKELAELANFFVNDAFACCHRQHASIVWMPKFLPSYVGFNLKNEIENLSKLTENPKHPLVIVLGGAKVFTKIGVIENFKKIADWILLGGALANNFLKAEGYEVGKSLIEEDKIREAEKLLENSGSNQGNYNHSFCADNCCLVGGEKIILPCDVKVLSGLGKKDSRRIEISNLDKSAEDLAGLSKIKKISQVKKTDKILDIGPETIKLFSEILSQAKTIFWNGPMGMSEDERFALGTQKITEAILKSKAQVVIGGGETVSDVRCQMSDVRYEEIFISTGGGAMLEFLAGKELVGLRALS